MDQLLLLVKTDGQHSNSDQFMSERIRRMWPQWMDGLNRYQSWIDASSNQSTVKPNLYNRTCLHIHLHLGFLTLKPSVGIEEEINKGGPLGELVQWTDLITALYLLGHKVTVSKGVMNTINLLRTWQLASISCKYIPQRPDLIYTDIRGFQQLRTSSLVPQCKFRVLDSFGTENKYNLRKPSSFFGLKLNLQQFQTFFPHTPDNSFLGFVIENDSAGLTTPQKSTGKPIALVAGKVFQMWQKSKTYLEVLSEFFDVHGNVADVNNKRQLPSFVTNHRVLSGTDYLDLLKSAKVSRHIHGVPSIQISSSDYSRVLVGLGFPYESPSPLEAIAHGVIFLNVKFKVPHSKRTNPFFREKPTDRQSDVCDILQLTSQHPYIEEYVGEPYSYLVDPEDAQQVRETVRRLLSRPPFAF
ncbi:Alpha-1 6-mannosylglycoprotein 6-beta-N-acetylglucosaminyltransferase A [Fasciolopsis buskii]|uniref:alpha-1,6-mannosyl-glycoprotein 6-beta-N-acetylglucosaminyltransferase n=1 Tax=Fasciolopsis buskii TaxID=27845 RepID=A0A8E0VN20_9TREM|nr:Alpha-1 6-mannosylglycoprotein 6-beta-N-acetylglucosaminyltransferase A [Fasciolopsis buski]